MKKLPASILIIIFTLSLVTGYLFKTYNPTAPGWKTDIVTYLAKLTDIAYLPAYFKSHSLPVYELNLNPDNYVFLNRNLPDATKTRILSAEYKQYVPAKLKFQDEEYDVDVRYRGVDFDHWAHPKKSWRIKFNDKKPFAGQTAINLIIPEDRGMYLEELSNYRAKKLGLLVPPSQFVILRVNGKTQGVYWQVEQWTSAFLERHQLPIGNLYGEDDEVLLATADEPLYQSTQYWRKYVQDKSYQEDNYAEISLLLDLLNNSSDQELFIKLPQILDIDTFLKWQAHSVLMGSQHQDSSHNARLFWHSDLGKFFIIPWDVLGNYGWPANYNPLVSRVLKNPDWLERRNRILQDYVADVNNLEEDLHYFDQLNNQTKIAVLQDYLKFFSNFGYLQQTKKYRQQLTDQFQLIKQNLADNNLPDETSGFNFPQSNILDVNHPDKLVDMSEFQDFDRLFDSSHQLTYGPGTHYITQTIIIPPNYRLTLLPGAKLIFAENASLVSYSPVTAQGLPGAPITLTAQHPDKPWGSFALVGEKASQSQFNYLIVEHGSEAVISGAFFTGALAAHGVQEISVKNSIFRFNHGDDGLNIKYADVLLANCQFIDNHFDGFDLDFGSGKVINNVFLRNGNDGLDLGSSSPLMKGNLIRVAGDKCISLGETSSPQIIDNHLEGCNMGIAVKDSSQPEIIDNRIINSHIGLASYQKKPIFPRQPFVFRGNQLENNEIDFEEEDASLRRDNL